MVIASDFETEHIQATAWVTTGELQPTRLYRAILQEWADVYDEEPVFLPAGAFPPEVPTFIIGSADQAWRLEVSPIRVNMFWRRLDVDDQTIEDVASTLRLFGERLFRLFEADQVPIGRLAAVASRVANLDSPASALANQFLQERWLAGPIDEPNGIELHVRKNFDMIPGLEVNSWVRIRTGKRIANDAPVVAVEQDLNSREEERTTRSLTPDQVTDFFDDAGVALDRVLRLYFPTPDESEQGAADDVDT